MTLTDRYKKTIIQWLLQPAIQDLLDAADFNTLYTTFTNTYFTDDSDGFEERGDAWELTYIFTNDLGIDVREILRHLAMVPKNFAYELDIGEHLEIPSNIESLEEDAFAGCMSLKSVIIPGSIDWIPSNLFEDCKNLESVVLNEGVGGIGREAFAGCKSLMQISLPKSVYAIDRNILDGSPVEAINYNGTKEQFKAIGKAADWCDDECNLPEIRCTDGNLTLKRNKSGIVVAVDG